MKETDTITRQITGPTDNCGYEHDCEYQYSDGQCGLGVEPGAWFDCCPHPDRKKINDLYRYDKGQDWKGIGVHVSVIEDPTDHNICREARTKSNHGRMCFECYRANWNCELPQGFDGPDCKTDSAEIPSGDWCGSCKKYYGKKIMGEYA